MAYEHTVMAIFNPGEPTGFLYTVGMPRQELFALNVPRALAKDVCSTMNFLSKRFIYAEESVQSGDLLFHLRRLEGTRRKSLIKTHLLQILQMNRFAEVLELCPINGWPDTPTDHSFDLTCSCCKCAECEA